jgi:alcohol dehydrogenase class IV
VLLGFGGGSPMDTAKAMAILAAAPPGTKMRAFKAPVAADRAALPVICIPTTAGTGSEATRFTVITDVEHDEKMLIAGLGRLPLAAIVDHELTFSVPRRTTADTGSTASRTRWKPSSAAAPTRSATCMPARRCG